MISISDAIPVQFWINGQPTFNEKLEPGIEPYKFYQLFNADDEIKLQFTDTEERIYKLTIFDCHGEQLAQLDFSVEEVEGLFIYSLEFNCEDQGITNDKVWLQISYFTYAYSVSGALTGLMKVVDGDVDFTPAAEVFEIEGDIVGLLKEVTDGLINILTVLGLSNNSLDIQITDVWVDGVAATLASGSLPLGTGSGATMTTKQTGSSQSVQVFYTSTIPDQHITVTDSDGNIFCQSSNSGSPLIFSGCVVNPGFPISIEAADGNCPP